MKQWQFTRGLMHGVITGGILGVLCFLLAMMLASCCTVTQKAVISQTASMDGNVPDSGILTETTGGYVVTAHFRDRYNALVATYGSSKTADGAPIFTPALRKDDGFTKLSGATSQALYGQQVWLITKQAMETMVVLSDLKRRGFKP